MCVSTYRVNWKGTMIEVQCSLPFKVHQQGKRASLGKC